MSDDLEARRAANRAAFPEVAKIVDEFREVFGDGVKVEGGSEGGKSFGAQDMNAAACDGCDGKVCKRTDHASVFCGFKLVKQLDPHPMEVYRKHGMGIRR